MNTGSFRRGPGFPHPYSQRARTPYSPVWYGASTELSSCCDSKDCPGRCWTSLGSMIAGAAVADHCDDHECCCCRHIRHHRHPQRSVNARYPQRDRDRRRKVQRYCWCREADMCWTIDHFRHVVPTGRLVVVSGDNATATRAVPLQRRHLIRCKANDGVGVAGAAPHLQSLAGIEPLDVLRAGKTQSTFIRWVVTVTFPRGDDYCGSSRNARG